MNEDAGRLAAQVAVTESARARSKSSYYSRLACAENMLNLALNGLAVNGALPL